VVVVVRSRKADEVLGRKTTRKGVDT